MQKWLGVLLVVLLAITAVSAQDLSEDDVILIEHVASAYDDLYAVSSVRMTGTNIIDQEISTNTGVTVIQTITQDLGGVMTLEDGQVTALQLTNEQVIVSEVTGQGTSTIELTMDMVLTEGVFYIQVRDVPPLLAGQFPRGWVNLTENPGGFPGFENINVEQYTSLLINNSFGSANVEFLRLGVLSVTEHEDEAINGQTMQVISLELDPQVLSQIEAFQGMFGVFDAGMGVDMESLMEQMLVGATMEVRVWIGVDDKQIHRVDTTLYVDADVDGLVPGLGTVHITQTLTSTIIYSDHDADVVIEAPVDE